MQPPTCVRMQSSVAHSALSCRAKYWMSMALLGGPWCVPFRHSPSGEEANAVREAACCGEGVPLIIGNSMVGDQRR